MFGGEPQQDEVQLINDDFGFETKKFEPRPAPAKAPREGKTKEELAAIRKAWMKTKFKDRANPKDPLSATATVAPSDNMNDLFNKSIKAEKPLAEPKSDLMARLVSGGKAKVSSAAMRALTSKNYEKLPEIQKKKAEAKLKEEAAEKKRKIAQMQKEMNDRIRSGLKKKREAEKKKAN